MDKKQMFEFMNAAVDYVNHRTRLFTTVGPYDEWAHEIADYADDKAYTSHAHELGTRLPGLGALSGADRRLRVFAKDAGAGNRTLDSCRVFWSAN